LKERISGIHEALTPRPLVAHQLAILSIEKSPPTTLETSKSIRKSLQLLNGGRGYVAKSLTKNWR
jgi:hypothetical protein